MSKADKADNKFLMSLPDELLPYVDDTVDVLNATKHSYAPKVNRQSVIRAMIRYCKKKNPQFSSGYSKYVSVKDEGIAV